MPTDGTGAFEASAFVSDGLNLAALRTGSLSMSLEPGVFVPTMPYRDISGLSLQRLHRGPTANGGGKPSIQVIFCMIRNKHHLPSCKFMNIREDSTGNPTAIAACLSASAYIGCKSIRRCVSAHSPTDHAYYIRHNIVPVGCADSSSPQRVRWSNVRMSVDSPASSNTSFRGFRHFPGNSLISISQNSRGRFRKISRRIHRPTKRYTTSAKVPSSRCAAGLMPADTARLRCAFHPVRQGYRRRARCHSERMALPQLVGQSHAGDKALPTLFPGSIYGDVCQ